MTKRAVLFAREAADPSCGTSAQIDACRALSVKKGYTVTGKLVDQAATPDCRPAFERLCELVAGGDVDVVVCYTFDRLVRTPQDLRLLRRDLPRGRASVECVYWDRRVE